MTRVTVAHVDLAALQANFRAIQEFLASNPAGSNPEGSNPEVSGDSAYLVDPYDVGAIARAIRDMQNDDDMVAHYEAAGRERAKLFSPERYSERLTELYKKLK